MRTLRPSRGHRVGPAEGRRKSTRVEEIDGIRGWAALVVVAFHIWPEVFAKVHPAILQPQYYILLDGPLAVYVFFILSGDALSTPIFAAQAAGRQIIPKMAFKRYFRLALPILLMTMGTYIALRAGAVVSVPAGNIVDNQEWLGTFLHFPFSWTDCFTFPFFKTFGAGPWNVGDYNQFLWTMPVELAGSILVFLFMGCYRSLKRPILVNAVLVVFLFLWNPYYSLFLLGILFASLRANGTLERLRGHLVCRVLGPVLVYLAWQLEDYLRKTPPLASAHGVGQHIHLWVQNNEKVLEGVLLVTGIYLSADLVRLFRGPIARFVGRISFPIYLWQFLVISTFESALIRHYSHDIGSGTTCVLIAAASFLLTIAVAYAISFVEIPMLRLMDRAVGRLIGSLSGAPASAREPALSALGPAATDGVTDRAGDTRPATSEVPSVTGASTHH